MNLRHLLLAWLLLVALACGSGTAPGELTSDVQVEATDVPDDLEQPDIGFNCKPGALDSCNGKDDDCDGDTDEDFEPTVSNCGIGACASECTTSCQDGIVVDGEPGTPAASDDVTCDGVDDDCDGQDDEDYGAFPTSCGVGACARTGERTCVDGAEVDDCAPGTPAAEDPTCDAIDDDCSGQADEDFIPSPTACGVGACAATGQTSCVEGALVDSCKPGAPAADDADCDAIDDDCSGQADEDFIPSPTACGVGACAATGQTSCVEGALVDSCKPGAPAANDADCDAIDDDCSGQADEDYAITPTTCGLGACASVGLETCFEGAEVDSCKPGAPAANDADCDSIDDDCSGQADEDFVVTPTTCGVGACTAKGERLCKAGGELFDTCKPGSPAKSDPSCDGIDQNCNGVADEEYVPSPTQCGVGACAAAGQLVCQQGAEVDTCLPGQPVDEDCDLQDDDCDGSTDNGGDDACGALLGAPAVCEAGGCHLLCELATDCLWHDWLVDCVGHWMCQAGVCRERCNESCGNGVCEPAKGEDAWTCGGDCKFCKQASDCSATQFCEFGPGACLAPGSCLNKPTNCPLTWAPVCGCDGLTYSNACERRKAGVAELHDGECEVTSCATDSDCLGLAWPIRCYGNWDCLDKTCTPGCGGSCGDGLCEPAAGENDRNCAPDCQLPEPTAFRTSSLTVVAPTLCVTLGVGGCVDVTSFVNGMIADQIASTSEPLDLLGVFTPLDLAVTDARFELLDATCLRDSSGTILECSPDPLATPNDFESPVFSEAGDCVSTPSVIAAPCFSSSASDARFRLLGVLFGLLDPTVAGSFAGDPVDPFQALDPGLIHGFLPRALAATISIQTAVGAITLAQLLDHEPTVVHEGSAGWWMTLDFLASRVPYTPLF